MLARPTSPLTGAVYGAAFGAVLAVLAAVATGAGHGTFVPLYVTSAPLSALGFGPGLAGAPIIWTLLGAMMLQTRNLTVRRVGVALLMAHYVSAAVLLLTLSNGDEYRHLMHALKIAPEVSALWVAIYVAGQVVIWRRVRSGAGDP